MLQVFDDGVLTDGLGRKIDFSNTIIIMTSNLGTKNIQGTDLGFGDDYRYSDNFKNLKNKIIKSVNELPSLLSLLIVLMTL